MGTNLLNISASDDFFGTKNQWAPLIIDNGD